MRMILSSLGLMASLVILLASVFMNYLFLSSMGKTPFEGHVFGAVSAAADILKALLPFFIAWGWRQRHLSIAVPGFMIWLLFACFSLLSAIGFSAQNRSVVIEVSQDQRSLKVHLRTELKEMKTQRTKLDSHRSIDVVKEAINRHQQNSRWHSTKNCKTATVELSHRYCKDYFELRTELATSKKAKELDLAIDQLRQKLENTSSHTIQTGMGAQLKLLSHFLPLSHERLEVIMTILIALLVELGASLGLYLSLNHQRKEQLKTIIAHPPVGLIEDFCLNCLLPKPNGALNENELFNAYLSWCEKEGFAALEGKAFKSAFGTLALDVGIPISENNYQQIELV
ncbi:MAG: hypothetical protein DHS20C07_04210 [Methyloligella sp.]|nr:MAG: hypothetical protein DHS20C07_04210 [Methyloligella sp.]